MPNDTVIPTAAFRRNYSCEIRKDDQDQDTFMAGERAGIEAAAKVAESHFSGANATGRAIAVSIRALADASEWLPKHDVARLQAVWDSIGSLPPIIFTEDEARAILSASAKPDTDTPVYPGVEGVESLFADAMNEWGARGYGRDTLFQTRFTDVVSKLRDDVLAALAAKPIAGMDAGEVKARHCPHGEPLNTCADCKREHQEATA